MNTVSMVLESIFQLLKHKIECRHEIATGKCVCQSISGYKRSCGLYSSYTQEAVQCNVFIILDNQTFSYCFSRFRYCWILSTVIESLFMFINWIIPSLNNMAKFTSWYYLLIERKPYITVQLRLFCCIYDWVNAALSSIACCILLAVVLKHPMLNISTHWKKKINE